MTFTGYDFLSITAIGDLCIILIGVFGKFINQGQREVLSKRLELVHFTI